MLAGVLRCSERNSEHAAETNLLDSSKDLSLTGVSRSAYVQLCAHVISFPIPLSNIYDHIKKLAITGNDVTYTRSQTTAMLYM